MFTTDSRSQATNVSPFVFDPDGAEAEDERKRYFGPLSFFGKKQLGDQWQYIQDTTALSDNSWKGGYFAIATHDVGRPHLSMVLLKNQSNMSYFIEMVRHFEVVPSSDCPRETRTVVLSDSYVSALDIIRKMRIRDLFSTPFTPFSYKADTTVWTMDQVLTINTPSELMRIYDTPDLTTGERINQRMGEAFNWATMRMGLPTSDDTIRGL